MRRRDQREWAVSTSITNDLHSRFRGLDTIGGRCGARRGAMR